MARKRRGFSIFSLSFLDIMSCGFGATILVFLVIDHASDVRSEEANRDLIGEVNFLEREVREGREGLARTAQHHRDGRRVGRRGQRPFARNPGRDPAPSGGALHR
jgi:hypothetical protein